MIPGCDNIQDMKLSKSWATQDGLQLVPTGGQLFSNHLVPREGLHEN
jgi:hypothetical protein